MTQHGRSLAAMLAAIVVAAGLVSGPAFADAGKDGNGNGNANGHAKQADREGGQENPGNGNGNPPAHAGGPAAETPPPGQAKEPGQPAQPQHSSKPASKPATKPAKPAKPQPAGKPAKPANPQPADKPANPHAKAGKTTICHATHSETNPYVMITISDNALPAHARHQDGEDIIPAPAGGCPQPSAASARPGSGIDAAPAEAEGKAEVAPAAAPAAPAASGEVLPALTQSPRGGVLGYVTASVPADLPRLRETLAEEASGGVVRESGVRTVTAPKADTGQLPFTGLEAVLVALCGVFLLLAGTLVRKVTGGPALTA